MTAVICPTRLRGMETDRILEWLSQPRHLGLIAGGLFALWLLRRLLSRPAASAHHATSRCQHCGWSGQVSKYKPICPRCAKPISL